MSEPHTCNRCGTAAPTAKFRVSHHNGVAYPANTCNRCYSIVAREKIQAATQQRLDPLLALLKQHGPMMAMDLIKIAPGNPLSIGQRLHQAKKRGLVVSEPVGSGRVRWSLPPSTAPRSRGRSQPTAPRANDLDADHEAWYAALQADAARQRAATIATMRARV